MTSPPRVGLEIHADGRVQVAPLDFLAGPLFQAYRAATGQNGATYDATLKASMVLPDMVPGLAEALRAAGLQPVVSPALAEMLKARAGEAREESETSKERLQGIIDGLAARGLELYPFQVIGVDWLRRSQSRLLGDDPGLGKSPQALMSVGNKVMIICQGKDLWVQFISGNDKFGIKGWRPDLTPIVLEGKGSFMWPQEGQAVILNSELLPRVLEDEKGKRINPFEDCPPGVDLITDEIHRFKNKKTHRGRSRFYLGRVIRKSGGKDIGLSGTPMHKRPPDLYHVLDQLDLVKQSFGGWPGFCRAWGSKKGYFGGQEFEDVASPAFSKILQRVMLRRLYDEVFPDMPGFTREIVKVEVDLKTREISNEIRARMEAQGYLIEDMIEKGQFSGPAFEEYSRVRSMLAAAKIPAMMDILDQYEEEETPVVVFSAHKPPIKALALRKDWAYFDGDTPKSERAELVNRFQAGEFKGIGCTIETGGEMYTMTRAHHALFVDSGWNPSQNYQAEKRIRRIGQKHFCLYRYLYAEGTIDEDVAAINLSKQRQADSSVGKATTAPTAAPVGVSPEALEAAAANVGTVTRKATGRRGPAGRAEEWARSALMTLAASGALSSRDKGFGGSLAAQIQGSGTLSDKQWYYAVKICRNYQDQIGACPCQG